MYFLMCSERSGSNLITKLLNGHANVCGPSTKHIINPEVRNLFRYGDLSKEHNWEQLLVDIQRLVDVDFSIWKENFSLTDLRELAPIGDVRSLIQNIFLAEAKANNKQHVFIKENQVYEFLPFLLLNFPEAKYVYQVRDPRDMALSWKKNKNHYGGVVRAANQWLKDQKSMLKDYYFLKQKGLAYLLRYEDLISDSDKYTCEIVDFLGLPQDRNMKDFFKDPLTQENSRMQEAWGNLSRGIMSDNKEKYLKELSEEEIKAVEKICQTEMKHLGYETKFSKRELENFDEQSLLELNALESSTIEYVRTEGVKLNMEAKEFFYKR